MTRPLLFACMAPLPAHFGLGPPKSSIGVIAVGWRMPIDPVDAGVPSEVAAILITALLRFGRVVFPSWDLCVDADEQWKPRGSDLARALPRGGGAGVLARLRGERRTVLVATARPETALKLFDDGGFAWSAGTQVAFVARTDHDLPTIDLADVELLLGSEWTTAARGLFAKGAMGVLRAGVDGDVAGFLAVDAVAAERFVQALAAAAEASGFDWSIVDPDRF